METIEIKKSPIFFVRPILWGTFTLWLLCFGLLVYLWAWGRYKYDKLEIRDNQLYSKFGIFNVDVKTIPLNRISMVSAKTDVISEAFGFGTLQIQSSASNSTISYPYVKDVHKVVEIINNKIAQLPVH